jgi:hypothetical protein
MLFIKSTKSMKTIIYALIASFVVLSGLAFANFEIKSDTSKKSLSKPLSAADKKAALRKWEASPDGVSYKEWEASAAGKKVYAGAAKIRASVKGYRPMEAVVTSLSLPQGSALGFGVMVKINGEDYILSFGQENSNPFFLNFNNEFEQLHNVKVNDKILIKSHSVSYAPKYAFPIVSGDYVEQYGKMIYKRAPGKGC